MTITSTQNRVSYAGNGAPGVPGTLVFAVPFRFLAIGDLVVLVRVDATGVSTTMTLDTNYSVAGEGAATGGTVTFLIEDGEPQTGETLIIYGNPAMTQLVDYISGGTFPAESHEEALDRLTLQSTRTREIAERALPLTDSSTDGSGQYNANSNRISSLGTPTAATDATTKTFVEGYVNTTVTNTVGPIPSGATYVTATGSTAARTLVSRWSDHLNPLDFGAVGDGSTDDTAAIQAAIQAIPTGGVLDGLGLQYVSQNLWLKSNMSMVNFRFLLPALAVNDVSLINIGNDLQTADGSHNSTEGIAAYSASQTSPGISNITLDNIHIDGNRTAQTNLTTRDGGRHGFCIKGFSTNIKLHNCSAKYCATDGMLVYRGLHATSLNAQDTLQASNELTVTNCTFEWNRRHGGAGDSINNGLWEGCKLNYNGRDINSGATVGDQGALSLGLRYGNGWDMEGYGLGSKVSNTTFRDCEARQNVRDGLLFYDTVDAAAGAFEPRKNILVTGCRLDIGTEPIAGDYAMTFTSAIATEANGSVFKDVIVSDCVLEGAINLRAVTNARIHGNIITIPSLLVQSNLTYVVDAFFVDNHSNQTNVAGTSNSTWVNHDYTFRGSATWNPGAIAAGATATVAVPCTGAKYGMYVSAGMSTLNTALNAALILSAFVVFPLNSVQVSIHNPTAGSKTVASGTINVKASRD